MNELTEMVIGKNWLQLKKELIFQVDTQGESVGGAICSNIVYAMECTDLKATNYFLRAFHSFFRREQWTKSFSDQCPLGAYVSTEIYDEFLNCLPPRYWKDGILQAGGAYSFDSAGRSTYITFKFDSYVGLWLYVGNISTQEATKCK